MWRQDSLGCPVAFLLRVGRAYCEWRGFSDCLESAGEVWRLQLALHMHVRWVSIRISCFVCMRNDSEPVYRPAGALGFCKTPAHIGCEIRDWSARACNCAAICESRDEACASTPCASRINSPYSAPKPRIPSAHKYKSGLARHPFSKRGTMTGSRQRAGISGRVVSDAARHEQAPGPQVGGRLRAFAHAHSNYLGAPAGLHRQPFGERRLLRAWGNVCLRKPYFVVQRPL